MKMLELAFQVLCLILVIPGQEGKSGPKEDISSHESRKPIPLHHPVNTITFHNYCNRSEEDLDGGLRQELTDIKDLLNTIISTLENTECCNSTNTTEISKPTSQPKDCLDVQENGGSESGVYTIKPDGADQFPVFCDMDTDGGGWTVFQRREDGTEDFYRNWDDYENGFGSLEGEHWLGNEKLYNLTKQKTYGLHVDLGDFEGASRYAKYNLFVVAGPADNYRLQLGSYSGDAGNAMGVCQNKQFSTFDQDHDTWGSSCALRYKGGWWYQHCHYANLNGEYHEGASAYGVGLNWAQWKGYTYSVKFTEMKLRPV
ncbi:microfibril-associated glycoprotein 4-like isoform X1 [Apostichopus japonicus]|uniref:microfibril-associated glycoprotein 4-like isoform X1 n=1 Tax=Stichopus japonicus TaxID=307972 RepID=UPI003AB454A0